MSSALSIAVSGLTSAVARATQSASNIVNALSTGKNPDADLINMNVQSDAFAANAGVVKTVEKMDKKLLDITA